MANKYLSDLHLGHAHILEMSKRGERFADVEKYDSGRNTVLGGKDKEMMKQFLA